MLSLNLHCFSNSFSHFSTLYVACFFYSLLKMAWFSIVILTSSLRRMSPFNDFFKGKLISKFELRKFLNNDLHYFFCIIFDIFSSKMRFSLSISVYLSKQKKWTGDRVITYIPIKLLFYHFSHSFGLQRAQTDIVPEWSIWLVLSFTCAFVVVLVSTSFQAVCLAPPFAATLSYSRNLFKF